MAAGALLRPLAPGDVEEAAALAALLPEAPHWPVAAYREALAQGSGSPRRLCLAVVQGRLAGFLVARIVGDEAELETITIHPQHQRQGLGGRLLGELLAQLSRDAVTEVMLELRASNLPAMRLYAGAGFRETGGRPGYYADPVEDAVLMNLSLPR